MKESWIDKNDKTTQADLQKALSQGDEYRATQIVHYIKKAELEIDKKVEK